MQRFEAKFLWEPRGFYDSVRGGGYDDAWASDIRTPAGRRLAAGSAPAQRLSGSAFAVWHLQWFERLQVPAYATGRFRKTEMISARELLDRAQADIGPLFDRPTPGLLLQAAGKENTRYTPHCAWLLGDDVPIGGSALFSIAGADLQPC